MFFWGGGGCTIISHKIWKDKKMPAVHENTLFVSVKDEVKMEVRSI